MKTFRVLTCVFVKGEHREEKIVSFGGTAQGETFAEALPFIEQTINSQYRQVQEHADMIDSIDAGKQQDDRQT